MWVKCDSPLVFINKVLLEHSFVSSFTYCLLHALHTTRANVSYSNRGKMHQTAENIYEWTLYKKCLLISDYSIQTLTQPLDLNFSEPWFPLMKIRDENNDVT